MIFIHYSNILVRLKSRLNPTFLWSNLRRWLGQSEAPLVQSEIWVDARLRLLWSNLSPKLPVLNTECDNEPIDRTPAVNIVGVGVHKGI